METHRVISDQIATKTDDLATHKDTNELEHKRIYNKIQNNQDGLIYIHKHAHDWNLSINKENHDHVINQNDVWHATKAVGKELINIKYQKDPQYKHRVTFAWTVFRQGRIDWNLRKLCN